jgi:hypothetical protein
MLAGIKHLYLVPDALLRSLPFDVLVTEPPAELAKEDHRSVHWLARDYAVTCCRRSHRCAQSRNCGTSRKRRRI